MPELGLLFTRREFQQGSLPILESGLDLGKLIRSLEDVLASGRPVSHVMVGHGEPVNNPDLNVPLGYLKTLAEVVRTAKRDGQTIDQVQDDPRGRQCPQGAPSQSGAGLAPVEHRLVGRGLCA